MIELDRAFLAVAMEQARKGIYSTQPNPSVGCVLVRGSDVIGRGYTSPAGGPHAEVNAIRDAGGRARGATAYVTLEPCCFHGRTPPCTEALLDAGIARVVVAEIDPHPDVQGEGLRMLQRAGVEVEHVAFEPALEINRGFRSRQTRGRPWVRLKIAASLDGRTAMASGESQWITGKESRADVQRLRAESCAIVTGIGTVLADDPRMNVRDDRFARDGVIRQPRRVVLDRRLRTPKDAQILQGDCLLLHSLDAPEHPHGQTRIWDGTVQSVLSLLAEVEANEVLIEAGATISQLFMASGLVDELVVYQAPVILGATARPMLSGSVETLAQAQGLDLLESVRIGEDTRLTYAVRPVSPA